MIHMIPVVSEKWEDTLRDYVLFPILCRQIYSCYVRYFCYQDPAAVLDYFVMDFMA